MNLEIDRVLLLETYGHPTALTKGIVMQFHKDTSKFHSITRAFWHLEWVQNRTVSPKILRYKIQRVTTKATKLKGAALDRFKEEALTLPAPTEETNPNPISPDTLQISHPIPSSSVTQPTSSSSQPCPDSPPSPPNLIHLPGPPTPLHLNLLKSRPKIMTQLKKKNIQMYELSKTRKEILFWKRNWPN